MAKTRNFDFHWEFGNFCIKTVHQDYRDRNSPLNKDCPIELIKYFDETHASCYTVAWFRLREDGYELHFIGSRPMEDIEPEEMADIWEQLIAAQKMLNAFFEASNSIEE